MKPGRRRERRGLGFVAPPAVLLPQLSGGDEQSFNLAFLDALAGCRGHVADRAASCDATPSLGILALARHAHCRTWHIQVASPFLPPRPFQDWSAASDRRC
ncbi:Imm49 family immunity protein [Streptomyces catenulae]|uniref:Imm49 family immunity protein n=1 Tax=Streptomyces catenulae TaxID=66875 RepID=A0ABV2Z6W1_9ACTN|nr:Imm49 family immunity protein [Streptomyces catenulae]